jgi:hypothetical protein
LQQLREVIQQVRKPIPAADTLIQKGLARRPMPAQILIQLEAGIASRMSRLPGVVDMPLRRFML